MGGITLTAVAIAVLASAILIASGHGVWGIFFAILAVVIAIITGKA